MGMHSHKPNKGGSAAWWIVIFVLVLFWGGICFGWDSGREIIVDWFTRVFNV